MSEPKLESFLRFALRRVWLQLILRRVATGLAIGAVAALVLCLLSLRINTLNGMRYAVWVLLAGGVIGLAAGLNGRSSFKQVALRIDALGGLKDRVHSALQFTTGSMADDYCRLQIRDALRAIGGQKVEHLFPWRWPREGTWAAVSGVLAVLAILMLPGPRRAEAIAVGPPPAVKHEAAALAEELTQYEDLAEELDSTELRQLTKKLKEMLSDMEHNAANIDEAMLQLARMAAEVNAAAAEFDPLALEQALQELAEGLSALDGFEQMAALLKQEEYDRAGQAAENFGQNIASGQRPLPPSGGLVDSRLGQLAQQAAAAGLPELSESLASLQKAVDHGSRSECHGALRRLGSTLSKYGKRVKVGRSMRAQLNTLNECKQCLSSGYCSGCKNGGECEGGNCRGIKMGLPSLTMKQSKKGSLSAGTGVSGAKYGQATELRAHRDQKQITGTLGEGESETETEVSTEGQESARMAYRKVYAKYQKLSDAVIIEEAVPLAHRQTIKRYFELIHPDRVNPEEQLKDVQLDVIAHDADIQGNKGGER